MRSIVLTLFLFANLLLFGQKQQFGGLWQGFTYTSDKEIMNANILFMNINVNGSSIDGEMREEIPGTTKYLIKKFKGSVKDNKITFKQSINAGGKAEGNLKFCFFEGTISFDDSTGYFQGEISASNCKNSQLKLVLFKSKAKYKNQVQSPIISPWVNKAILNFQKGYNAPDLMDAEMKAFKFTPIYFNYGEILLLDEYKPSLLKMIRIVDSHSDLRIKITGHTDADGKDTYNLELSKLRAKTIALFLIENGLSTDKIIIDFKGESSPLDSNETPEGKQKNRRVEFSFI